MIWSELSIPGCFSCEIPLHKDLRGEFFKTLNTSLVQEIAPDFRAMEAYTTVSAAGVLRGMHFQSPPADHHKLVSISRGAAHDVLVDLRSGPGFGAVCSIEMTAGDTCTMVFVARGVAHGFLARTDACTMNYVTTSEHSPENDHGILWSSIDHEWPTQEPVLSPRDRSHQPLEEATRYF